MKKIFLQAQICIVGLIICLTINDSFAQMNIYPFSSSTSIYTEITGGYLLGSASNDETGFNNPNNLAGFENSGLVSGPGFPIGFNYLLQGRVYNRIGISTNGWVALGRNGVSMAADAVPIDDIDMDTIPVLMGFSNDLVGKSSSSMRIQTVGNPGSRVCVIQWKNYDLYEANPSETYNFQIQIHESGNAIVFHYGQITTNLVPGSEESAMLVGLKGFINSDKHVRAGSWAASTFTNGVNWQTNSMRLNTGAKPANGQRFNFGSPGSPPVVNCPLRPVAAFTVNSVSGGYQFVNTSTGADSYNWSFGAGATPATFTTTTTGPVTVSYASSGIKTVVLRAIKSGCADSVITRQITVTSAKSALSQAQVKSYPNPASKQLFVENNTNNLLNLQVFDIVGHLVLDNVQIIKNSKSALDIAALSPGTYILHFQTSQGVRSEKIVVQ